jgi:hypothetical protein
LAHFAPKRSKSAQNGHFWPKKAKNPQKSHFGGVPPPNRGGVPPPYPWTSFKTLPKHQNDDFEKKSRLLPKTLVIAFRIYSFSLLVPSYFCPPQNRGLAKKKKFFTRTSSTYAQSYTAMGVPPQVFGVSKGGLGTHRPGIPTLLSPPCIRRPGSQIAPTSCALHSLVAIKFKAHPKKGGYPPPNFLIFSLGSLRTCH